jgi:hypothetical protein
VTWMVRSRALAWKNRETWAADMSYADTQCWIIFGILMVLSLANALYLFSSTRRYDMMHRSVRSALRWAVLTPSRTDPHLTLSPPEPRRLSKRQSRGSSGH